VTACRHTVSDVCIEWLLRNKIAKDVNRFCNIKAGYARVAGGIETEKRALGCLTKPGERD
jgi:hypothetical protein